MPAGAGFCRGFHRRIPPQVSAAAPGTAAASAFIEENGAVCVWRNRTDVRRCVTAFSVSVFEKTDGGLWSRRDGMTKERGYSLRTLKTALAEASLLPLAVFGDCDLTAPAEDAERWFLLARAV